MKLGLGGYYMLLVIRILVCVRHFCSHSFHQNTNKNVRESNYLLYSGDLQTKILVVTQIYSVLLRMMVLIIINYYSILQ